MGKWGGLSALWLRATAAVCDGGPSRMVKCTSVTGKSEGASCPPMQAVSVRDWLRSVRWAGKEARHRGRVGWGAPSDVLVVFIVFEVRYNARDKPPLLRARGREITR